MLIENKGYNHSYEIIEKFEAGVELIGTEVKSLRAHQGSLIGAYISVDGGNKPQAFLVNTTIPAFQKKNAPKDYDEKRRRRLLLSKKELVQLSMVQGGGAGKKSSSKGGKSGKSGKAGLTIIPISFYNSGRKIKLSIAVVRGKKKFDKRQDIKRREADRHIERALKYQ